MQSLFKSLVESIKPVVEGAGSAVVTGGTNDEPGTLTSCAIDGTDYSTIPSRNEGEPIWPPSTKIQEGWESLKQSVQNSEAAQQHLKQAGELVSKGFSIAAESVVATAKVVMDDVSAFRNATPSDCERAKSTFNPNSPPPAGHPFASLPWEDIETKYHGEPWLEIATLPELRQAIKRILIRVAKDPSVFEFPPPPSTYQFEFDPWRQAFAAAMVVIDQELARLRYDLVPKKLREDDFWLMYFYKIETETLPSIPQEIIAQLVEDRAGVENTVPPEEREVRAARRIEVMRKKLEDEEAASMPQTSLLKLIGRAVGADFPEVSEPNPPTSEIVQAEAVDDPTPTPEHRIDDNELEEFEKMLAKGF